MVKPTQNLIVEVSHNKRQSKSVWNGRKRYHLSRPSGWALEREQDGFKLISGRKNRLKVMHVTPAQAKAGILLTHPRATHATPVKLRVVPANAVFQNWVDGTYERRRKTRGDKLMVLTGQGNTVRKTAIAGISYNAGPFLLDKVDEGWQITHCRSSVQLERSSKAVPVAPGMTFTQEELETLCFRVGEDWWRFRQVNAPVIPQHHGPLLTILLYLLTLFFAGGLVLKMPFFLNTPVAGEKKLTEENKTLVTLTREGGNPLLPVPIVPSLPSSQAPSSPIKETPKPAPKIEAKKLAPKVEHKPQAEPKPIARPTVSMSKPTAKPTPVVPPKPVAPAVKAPSREAIQDAQSAKFLREQMKAFNMQSNLPVTKKEKEPDTDEMSVLSGLETVDTSALEAQIQKSGRNLNSALNNLEQSNSGISSEEAFNMDTQRALKFASQRVQIHEDREGFHVSGSLTHAQVEQVISQHMAQIRNCYEAALRHKSGIQGRVAIDFVINVMGRVETARITESEVNNPGLEACILSKTKVWQFPSPPDHRLVNVIYPFVLRTLGVNP